MYKHKNWMLAVPCCLLLTVGCQATEQAAQTQGAAAADKKLAEDKGETPEKPDDGLPEASTLLAETAKALGGDKLAEVKGVYSEATIDMKSMGLKGTAKTWWQGDKFYGDSDIQGVGRTRIGGTLGGQIWSEDPINGLRTLAGRESEQAAWSSSVCMPCTWQKHFKSAKTTKVADNRAEITLNANSGDEMVLVLDLTTKLPVSQKFKQASPLGDTPIEIKFEDYREVEGIKLAYKQVVHASIMSITSEVTKVEVNPEIDPKVFEMPAPKGGVIDPNSPEPKPEPTPEQATGEKPAGEQVADKGEASKAKPAK